MISIIHHLHQFAFLPVAKMIPLSQHLPSSFLADSHFDEGELGSKCNFNLFSLKSKGF